MLKMIFSVQNSNLLYSVEFSPDLVHIQVRETVYGVFLAGTDISIQVWHMVELVRRDFNEHHIRQVPMTENQLEEMQMIEEISGHWGMNYDDTLDYRYMTQPVNDFLFPWEEAGSDKNPITIVEDEGFSEAMTPPALQPRPQPRPALRSMEKLQKCSAARQPY